MHGITANWLKRRMDNFKINKFEIIDIRGGAHNILDI